MANNRNGFLWVDQGYILFAEEGMEGIQIERLSRILKLNKSGFYHHFGDLEGYYIELLRLHEQEAESFIKDMSQLREFDPGLLNLLIDYSASIMFQVQLARSRDHELFLKVREHIEQRMADAMLVLWSNFLGIQNNDALALRYYHMIRDMFYTRISFANLNYEFMHALAKETKFLFVEIQQTKYEQVPEKSPLR